MIRKIFRQMLVSQIISAMTVTLCMLVDSIMISRYLGMDSITAYGYSTPVLLVFAAFGSMLSVGIQVKCGKTMGSADREGTDACYTQSIVMAAAVAAAGFVLVFSLAGPLSTLLGAGKRSPENEVYFLTRDYLRGFIIGAPAFILAQIMIPYMQIAGKRTVLVAAVLAMTVFDILFDILNVTVFHGGTFGMGLASSLSYYIAFGIGLTYFLGKNCMFRFRKKGISGKLGLEILKYGIPTVVNQISLVLLVFLLNNVLARVEGNSAVAAYSVISTLGNICYCVGSGVASVALTLATFFCEDEDRSSLYLLMRVMIVYAVLLDIVLIAVVWIAAPYAIGLFVTDDPVVFAFAKQGLRLFSLSLLSSALNTALKNYYQGVGHTRLTEAISFAQNFLFTAIYALVLSSIFGARGVWISFVLGETTTLVLTVVYVFAKQKRAAFNAETFAMLPDSFGVQDSECMEETIRSMEEVVAVSEKANDFCLAHGDTDENGMLIALFIEEMAANTVNYGFTADKRDNTIELRVFYKDGTRYIRMRDDCRHFDPVSYMDVQRTEEDPTAHIGIRMVMGMAKSANYINSLGLNNLTLTL